MTETEREKGSAGSSFDDFLVEQRIADEVTRMALKKVIAAANTRKAWKA